MTTIPRPAQTSDPVGRLLLGCVLSFLLVVLNLVFDAAAFDGSLMPRLLVLAVFLTLALPVVAAWHAGARLDTSVLRDPVILATALYLGATWISLASAFNLSAGLTDAFRTTTTFVTLCLCCLVLPLADDWRILLCRVMVVSGLIAVGVGGSETVRHAGFGLHDRRTMEAVTGLMSNVNLFAGMLALLAPWCVLGTLLLRGTWRMAAIAAAVGVMSMIGLLQSRGGWVAVSVGGAVAAAATLGWPRGTGLSAAGRRTILGLTALAVAVLVSGVALWAADTPVGRRLHRLVVARPHQAALGVDGGRAMVWAASCRMIADHPFTGVGAGNFPICLHDYSGTDVLDFSRLPDDNWPQPHNDYLWVFAEKGLPGILAFLAMLTLAAAAARRVLVADPPVEEGRFAVCVLAGLAIYATLSCVDFPLERISHQVHLAVLLAAAAVLAHQRRPVSTLIVPLPWKWVLPVVMAVLGLTAVYAATALRQEKEVLASRAAGRAGDWQGMRDAARRATLSWKTLDPFATPIAFLEGMAEAKLGRLPEATVLLERALAENPGRMEVIVNLGTVYAQSQRLDDAIECFAIAANRYPDRLEPRHNLGSCLIDAGRFAEAVAVLEGVPEEFRGEATEEALALARRRMAEEPSAEEPRPAAAR